MYQVKQHAISFHQMIIVAIFAALFAVEAAMGAASTRDEDVIASATRTITDNIGLYEAWAEEIPYPAYHTIPIPAVHSMDLIHEGKIKKEDIDDLGDIILGKIPAIRDSDQKIIYSVGGMPTVSR